MAALRVAAWVGRRIPLSAGRALGRVLGALAFHVVRRERRKAIRNIAVAFPDWTERERRRVIKRMFRHLGESLFEILWLPNLDPAAVDATTIFEAYEPITAHVQAGRAVVAFSAHCGNWEWLANAATVKGTPVIVLQRERTEEGLSDFLLAIRAHAGVQTIDRGSTSAGRELIQSMRRGNVIGFLIDQNIRAESVKVHFFGKPALTPIGPARLAIRAEAAVMSVFIERLPDGKHHIRFSEPIQTRRDDDPVALTARMTAAIEEQIRRAPEQWVWMHDRWRERPEWEIETGGEHARNQSS